MSRTVHHLVDNLNEISYDYSTPGALRARNHLQGIRRHTLYDLRFSDAELRRAEKEGRRPQPVRLRHRVDYFWYCTAYASETRIVGYLCNERERASRTLMRDQLAQAARRYNSRSNTRRYYTNRSKNIDLDVLPLTRWSIEYDL